MELRSLLKSGHSAAPGVLALRAVQPALTLAMPAGGDSPPMGRDPMPDPAGGRAGSPPSPVNLTPGERAHLKALDVPDFEVLSRQDWSRLGESHAPPHQPRQPSSGQGPVVGRNLLRPMISAPIAVPQADAIASSGPSSPSGCSPRQIRIFPNHSMNACCACPKAASSDRPSPVANPSSDTTRLCTRSLGTVTSANYFHLKK
jgi:hypothetical protein